MKCTCEHCGKRVGIVTFGESLAFVNLRPIDTPSGTALVLHNCVAEERKRREPQGPEDRGRASPAPPANRPDLAPPQRRR